MAIAITMANCTIIGLDKQSLAEQLRKMRAFSEMFLTYVLTRKMRIEEDLVDHLLNSSEKKLARAIANVRVASATDRRSSRTGPSELL